MKILLLAPQPYYQERGTLIAVDLLVRALSERGDQVDILTFHLGEDRGAPGARIHRIRPWPRPAAVRPGLSLAKLWCDLFMFGKAFRLARTGNYDLVHAVEEAGFMALAIGALFGVPYVLDMDSSMASQIVERYRWTRPLHGTLRWLETLPMRRAAAVVPMCEDLAVEARRHCRGEVHVLRDVSLLRDGEGAGEHEDLRADLGLEGPVVMYIGNLERYQGIDLLLESFQRVAAANPLAALVIIGGAPPDIAHYRAQVLALGLSGRVHLVGPRPVTRLGHCMSQADVLVSPRIQGTNTPMKIYSYLDSGRAVVATDLPTHTQVMSANEAVLVPPEPEAMAGAILELLDDPAWRERLAANAQALVQRRHSLEAFHRSVNEIFDAVEKRIARAS
jgi:glycosyltransferase involved in cell wall biosynthesis